MFKFRIRKLSSNSQRFQFLCRRHLPIPLIHRNGPPILPPPQPVIDFLILLPYKFRSISLLFLPVGANLAAGLDRFSRRDSHAVAGVICTYSQEIVATALAPTRNISSRHTAAEVIVEETGQFLKFRLLS